MGGLAACFVQRKYCLESSFFVPCLKNQSAASATTAAPALTGEGEPHPPGRQSARLMAVRRPDRNATCLPPSHDIIPADPEPATKSPRLCGLPFSGHRIFLQVKYFIVARKTGYNNRFPIQHTAMPKSQIFPN